ncbi:MAG: hemerythrin domain-containing protein [Desulfobacteraceae bacterium]|jgi:hemerythrin-like domain-containing protein
MIATRALQTEHALILKQLDNLSTARARLESGRWPPSELFAIAVAFARNFADRFHHVKEEFVLFGVLARREEGRLDLEIGALRHQHECCRNAITEMDRALKGYEARDEIATTALLTHLAAYTSLLRRHIHLEDTIFFPMAEAALTHEDQRSVTDYFHEEELRLKGKDLLVKSRQQVNTLREMLRRQL